MNRLGFGTIQLTGPGVWGPPRDRNEAVQVLRRAAERGVTLFDTADSYGPAVVEPLLRSALTPYYDSIVLTTKAGMIRPRPNEWFPCGHPAYLRQQCELSLRNLALERIPLFQLHGADPAIPFADQVAELAALQQEGKVAHIGLSGVTCHQIDEALTVAPIAAVQNMYGLADRSLEDVLHLCEGKNIAFLPWDPPATAGLTRPDGPLAARARELSATPSQLALAWLLRRSPVVLPIPSASSVPYLDENLGAAAVPLSDEVMFALAENAA